MKARVVLKSEIDLSDIHLGDKDDPYTLNGLLFVIHAKITTCVQDLSIQRQLENPNLVDIDAPLYAALNIIEKIRKF